MYFFFLFYEEDVVVALAAVRARVLAGGDAHGRALLGDHGAGAAHSQLLDFALEKKRKTVTSKCTFVLNKRMLCNAWIKTAKGLLKSRDVKGPRNRREFKRTQSESEIVC